MARSKIAITVPDEIIQHLDTIAKKRKMSRSKLISEILENNLSKLLDEELASTYDDIYSDERIQKEQKYIAEHL